MAHVLQLSLLELEGYAVEEGVFAMLLKKILNWDSLPVPKRLDLANNLARRYGIPDFWYWRDSPIYGHELIMVWKSDGKNN